MFLRIKKHVSVKGLLGALVGAVFLFLLATPIVSGIEHAIERFAPTHSYYIYHGVKPAQDAFARGETLRFNSFVQYKKTTKMQWQDTLYCYQDEGLKKYPTQYWPENLEPEVKPAGTLVNMFYNETGELVRTDSITNGELEYWEIYIHDPDPTATSCYVCGNIKGYTPNFYPKRDNFCTETFLVNQ